MKRQKSSGSSLFLMEIIVNILLFAILLCVCLQFFARSHKLTQTTTSLERAVTVCSNVASIYENGNGNLDCIALEYPNCVSFDDHMVIYLDENMLECDSHNNEYTLEVAFVDADLNSNLKKITIQCQKDSETLYEITVCNYRQLSVAEGGDQNE